MKQENTIIKFEIKKIFSSIFVEKNISEDKLQIINNFIYETGKRFIIIY